MARASSTELASTYIIKVNGVACDMNSDFQEEFEEMYPHIQPVYNQFFIIETTCIHNKTGVQLVTLVELHLSKGLIITLFGY